MTATTDRANAVRFDDAEVARIYGRRQPYAQALFETLFARTPGRGAALDIGCGPGTVTAPLAERFARVDAVDPSSPMLAAARSANRAANIRWIEGKAETAPLLGPYDLVAAGASLHWCDHAVLFPRIADLMAPGARVAAIAQAQTRGEAWSDAYDAFMTRWLASIGSTYDPAAFQASGEGYRAWLDDEIRETFVEPRSQPLDDFIEAMHATATWTRERMGAEQADAFDAELRAALAPYAPDGVLRWTGRSLLTTGEPRRSPRGD